MVAPGGDVLGVEWDPYSGDHLQFYKFEADTEEWTYTETPVHQPFYDREWIAVLPGPVTIGGETHEYVSFVKGGIPKEVWFYSTDGVNYTQVTSKDLDRFFLSGAETQGPLPTTGNVDSDWIQENTNGGPAPAIAIEGTTRLGKRIPPPPEAVPPVLGEHYATYTFDQGAEGWTIGGIPTWTRGAPGTKDGTDDPATASFGIEGPTQYVDNMNASLTSPPMATDVSQTVLELWIKAEIEDGFDFVHAEWSGDGTNWSPLSLFTGQTEGYPNWSKVTLGFGSPGGDVQVRFRFESDQLCSGVNPACGALYTGARVDEVVIGRQAA